MKRKILIIDELSPYTYFIKRVLSNEGYEVGVAEILPDHLHELDQNRVDLILLDIKIDNGQGLNYLKQISQNINLDIPVIVISDSKNLTEIENAFKSGAYDYLIKPINLRDMKNKIEHAFKSKYIKKARS
ncbi:MAG: response regulator [Bacteroidetes bacterium]|nr:response regulator [Bacteroidota bacterium]